MKIIIQNFSYVFLANIANATSKFIYLVIITKFLTKDDLGAYTLALALAAPISLLFNMKMRSYIISSDFLDYKKFLKFRNINNIMTIIIATIISIIFYPELLWVMIFVVLSKILEINSEFYQAWPNREKKFKTPAKLMILRTVINTIVFSIIAIMTKNLILTLVITALVQFIMLIIEKQINLRLTDVYNYKEKTLNYRILLFTLMPLGIVQALMSFSTSIPKYLLDYFSNIEIVGIYSAVAYLMSIISLFMGSINQTLLPYIKKIYNNDLGLFRKFINIYLNVIYIVLSFIFLILTLIWGENILTILYTSEFAKYSFILNICAASIFFNMSGWSYDSALLLSRKIKYQPLFLIINTIFTVIIGIYLVQNFQLVGASLTLVIFQFINTLFKAIYFNTSKRIKETGG
ncbi:lipopolysaccharide biosynthesis protein [Staphylococcus equorum]|uniref:lipopolysaccharide biosynthesis protein n=1 Tax=Staphylococcus equorum TaxID=246432 RepID=UPI000399E72F|nr:oligosaccharide flippase family protein [Staphylococcus equorum]